MKKKSNKFEPRLPKTALNVVREVYPGGFQVYQIYAGMQIPLLGKRIRGEFHETPARTQLDAFYRLEQEYYS